MPTSKGGGEPSFEETSQLPTVLARIRWVEPSVSLTSLLYPPALLQSSSMNALEDMPDPQKTDPEVL